MTTSSDATDVDDKFDVLMDANDHILEKVVRKDMHLQNSICFKLVHVLVLISMFVLNPDSGFGEYFKQNWLRNTIFIFPRKRLSLVTLEFFLPNLSLFELIDRENKHFAFKKCKLNSIL